MEDKQVITIDIGTMDPGKALAAVIDCLPLCDARLSVSNAGIVSEPVPFKLELQQLLNRHSQENGSNTPDFILASYLQGCLDNFNLHTRERDRWWGNRSVLGVGNEVPPVNTSGDSLLR